LFRSVEVPINVLGPVNEPVAKSIQRTKNLAQERKGIRPILPVTTKIIPLPALLLLLISQSMFLDHPIL
jgi:hypothetical protein